LLTSHHASNSETLQVEESIKNIISTNHLENKVIHITQYVSQQELNERLFMSDLGFLWSGIETESSSASLKEFVAARLPLIKTNSNHYHDINIGCITVSKDMDIFVAKVMEIYNNRAILDGLKADMEDMYNKLNYNENINNFIGIFNE